MSGNSREMTGVGKPPPWIDLSEREAALFLRVVSSCGGDPMPGQVRVSAPVPPENEGGYDK